MIKKLIFEGKKMERLEEKIVIGGFMPPDIMECLWLCAPGCQSTIEGDGELSTSFGLIVEPEQPTQ